MVIVMEIVAAVLVMHVYQEWVGEKARQFMEDTIQSDYILPSEGKRANSDIGNIFILAHVPGPANSVTVLWDTIMTSLTCCGVNSYLDFQETEGSAEVTQLLNMYYVTLFELTGAPLMLQIIKHVHLLPRPHH